jgi:hypothetical protein
LTNTSEARTLELLRELKRARGEELRRRHGAHALGIGRRSNGERGTLALVFYVAPGGEREPVPDYLELVPEGSTEPVRLPTHVVVAEQATSESE